MAIFASANFNAIGNGASISGAILDNGLGGSGTRTFISNGSSALTGNGTGGIGGDQTAWSNVVPGQLDYRVTMRFDPLAGTSAIQLTGRKSTTTGNASYYGVRLAPDHASLVIWEGDGTTATPPYGTIRASQALSAPGAAFYLQADFAGEVVTGRVIRVSDSAVLATVSHTFAAGRMGENLAFGFADGGGIGVIDDLVFEDLAPADTTPPTLTTPAATVTGTATATGSVTTTEAGPAWAVMTTTATTPTAAQIKAGTGAAATATATLAVGSNPAVFAFTGLTPSTGYYLHITQDDTATPANTATPVTAAMVTTNAADTVPPTLSLGGTTVKSSALIELRATTDEGNGTMYAVLTTSATPPLVAQILAGQNNTGTAAAWAGNQAIASTGIKTFNATGLAANTAYYAYVVHRDASNNDSTVLSVGPSTTFRAGATGQWIIDHPGSFMSQCIEVGDEDAWFDWEQVTPPATGSWTEGPYADGTGVFEGHAASSMVILLRKNGGVVGNFTVSLYDTLASAAQGGGWSVRNLATANQPGAWSLSGGASATQAGAWSVRSMASATQSGAWSVLGVTIVSATQSGAWSVLGVTIVSATQSGAWRVLSGTRVPSSGLRVVVIDADGAGILGSFSMQPGEVLDFGFDFQPWLNDCTDTIASYAVTSTDGMPIMETDRSEGVIVALVGGTEDGVSHKLTCRIQTDGGRTKEADITIRVKEF